MIDEPSSVVCILLCEGVGGCGYGVVRQFHRTFLLCEEFGNVVGLRMYDSCHSKPQCRVFFCEMTFGDVGGVISNITTAASCNNII